MNVAIFREYDVRGLVERDLTPDLVVKLGRAAGTYAASHGVTAMTLGRDCRLSSGALSEAMKKGLLSTGLDVIHIGTCATPILYFSVRHLKTGGGVMVTGSHNPPPKGTEVPTFKRTLTAEENAALDLANNLLSNCGPLPSGVAPAKAARATLSPSRTPAEKLTFKGPAAISGLRVKADVLAPSTIEALRALAVEIRWDGESEPSVWAPLGDFFGTAPGLNCYQSLPLGVSQDGWWYCNWFMPFARSAEVTFRQDGDTALDLDYQIFTKPLTRSPEAYARFHAKWHRDAIMDEIKAMLRALFRTENEMTFVISGPGSAGMEACLREPAGAGRRGGHLHQRSLRRAHGRHR